MSSLPITPEIKGVRFYRTPGKWWTGWFTELDRFLFLLIEGKGELHYRFGTKRKKPPKAEGWDTYIDTNWLFLNTLLEN